MLKFIKKIFFLLPILFLVIIVNYLVDPANLFKGNDYERGISKLLLKGTNVANISNYDERLLQKYYIDELWDKKDIVVLGSSRSLQIKSSLFPGEDFFNNSVSGASLEDLLSIYHLYRKRNFVPNKVIISLDPWILNKYNNQIRWKSLEDDYIQMNNEMVNNTKVNNAFGFINIRIPEKYLEIVSLSYFQKSYEMILDGKYEKNKQLKANNSNNTEYYQTSNTFEAVLIKVSDGSVNYDIKFRNAKIEEINEKAIGYATDKPVYSLGRFTSIDEELKNKLEMFLDTVKKDNVEITLFLSPYHPKAYDILSNSNDYRIIVDVQNYYEQLAIKKGVRIIGSYNPNDLFLVEDDFFDGMHPKEKAVSKIFKN